MIKNTNIQKGFSLVEVLVSISLLSALFLSVLMISNQKAKVLVQDQFTKNSYLETQRYQMILSHHQGCINTLFGGNRRYRSLNNFNRRINFAAEEAKRKKIRRITLSARSVNPDLALGSFSGNLYSYDIYMQAEDVNSGIETLNFVTNVFIQTDSSNQIIQCGSFSLSRGASGYQNPERALFDCKARRFRFNRNNDSHISPVYSCADMGPGHENDVLITANCTGIGGLYPKRTGKNGAQCFQRNQDPSKTIRQIVDRGQGRLILNCCKL